MQPLLQQYFSNGCLSRIDKLLSVFYFGYPFRKNALFIAEKYNKIYPLTSSDVKIIRTEPYSFHNPVVLKVKRFIEKELFDDVLNAFVHGSIGTGELIPYSDFDGLIIIKSEVFANPQRLLSVTKKIKTSEQLMFELDILQHHGWAVITEKDLLNWNNSFFPVELFDHCKTIFGSNELTLHFAESTVDHKTPFYALCKNIERKKAAQKCPATLFELKILLSEVLLLPALYVQARDKKGIFKKYSFEAAQKDFDAETWNVVQQASSMRLNWNQSGVNYERERTAARFKVINFLSRMLRSRVPADLKKNVNSDFFIAVQRLIDKMKTNLEGESN